MPAEQSSSKRCACALHEKAFFFKFRCAPKLAKTAILIHMLYLLSYKYKFIAVLVLVTFRNIGLFRMSVIIFLYVAYSLTKNANMKILIILDIFNILYL